MTSLETELQSSLITEWVSTAKSTKYREFVAAVLSWALHYDTSDDEPPRELLTGNATWDHHYWPAFAPFTAGAVEAQAAGRNPLPTATLHSFAKESEKPVRFLLAWKPDLARLYPAYKAAADLLICDVKAHSYWPWRRGWLEALRRHDPGDRRFAAESLITVVGEWAATHPYLAALRDMAPPLPALYDLAVICGLLTHDVSGDTVTFRRDADPTTASTLVSVATRLVVAPPRVSPMDALHTVHRPLMTVAFAAPSTRTELIAATRRSLARVDQLVHLASSDDAVAGRESLSLVLTALTGALRTV